MATSPTANHVSCWNTYLTSSCPIAEVIELVSTSSGSESALAMAIRLSITSMIIFAKSTQSMCANILLSKNFSFNRQTSNDFLTIPIALIITHEHFICTTLMKAAIKADIVLFSRKERIIAIDKGCFKMIYYIQ